MESAINQTDKDPRALISLIHSEQHTLSAQRRRIQSQSERIEELELLVLAGRRIFTDYIRSFSWTAQNGQEVIGIE